MAKEPKKGPEADRICNLRPSPDTEYDLTFETAMRSGTIVRPRVLPAGVDLRTSWWDIGDQKRTGSCVGWAVADGATRYQMVKAGKIPQSEKLSPRCAWMAAKETDEFRQFPESFVESAGTSIKAALNIVKRFGSALESEVPFEINHFMWLGDDILFDFMAKRRITNYYQLRKNFTKWRTWLAANGPIIVGLDVDSTWRNATATKGMLDNFIKPPPFPKPGHAAVVVGYTSTGRFILRNSWGTNWGDQGFAYASEAYIKAGFWNESYGVAV